jgi:hypothetical protein
MYNTKLNEAKAAHRQEIEKLSAGEIQQAQTSLMVLQGLHPGPRQVFRHQGFQV